MMHQCPFTIAILFTIFAWNTGHGELPVPKIESGRFDSNGRLLITVNSPPPAGCTLALWGGTSSTSVDTLITAKKLQQTATTLNSVNIRTKKKYYCRRRTLYVRVISECYPEAAPSEVARVKVPPSNIQG